MNDNPMSHKYQDLQSVCTQFYTKRKAVQTEIYKISSSHLIQSHAIFLVAPKKSQLLLHPHCNIVQILRVILSFSVQRHVVYRHEIRNTSAIVIINQI